MSSADRTAAETARLTLVRRQRDEDDDEPQFRPLEWGIIRRLFDYTAGRARQRNWLIFLTAVRSAQLPALVWLSSAIIADPIAHHNLPWVFWGVAAYALLAIVSDGKVHEVDVSSIGCARPDRPEAFQGTVYVPCPGDD